MTDTEQGDPKIEKWLADAHVSWSFDPRYPLENIDVKRSHQNQARPGQAIDPDVVDLYTSAYRDGAQFPAIVVRKTSRQAKKTVQVDGNHRTAAALAAGVTLHPAYVIECEEEAAMRLMFEANLKNGVNLSKPQRIELAVYYVESGMTARDAARRMGVNEVEVSNRRTLNRAAIRARTAQVKHWDEIPQGHRLEIAKIGSDPVFAATAKLLLDAGMQGEEARRFIKTVKDKRSDELALKFIVADTKAREKQIQRNFGGVVTRQRRRSTSFDVFAASVATLRNTDPVDVDESAPTSEARRRLRKELALLGKHIIAVDKTLAG